MGLNSALQIGRSGILSHQTALEVTGNNLANVATKGYTRQVVNLSPAQAIEYQTGQFVGMGVKIDSIIRATDNALLTRLRTAISDQKGAGVLEQTLTQIETIHAELSDYGMSSRMDKFFDSWSQLANNPTDTSLRALTIEQGKALADYVGRVNSDINQLRQQTDDKIRQEVRAANGILEQIATLNGEVVSAERGQGGANSLRDERDLLINELSEFIDVSTVEQDSGSIDIFVGSIPVVLAGENRGLAVDYTTVGNDTEIRLRLQEDGSHLQANSGKIGQLIGVRENEIAVASQTLNDFASQMIFQVNRVHSQGQGLKGFDSAVGSYTTEDPTQSMTLADSGMAFAPTHGSFKIHVTQVSTDTRLTDQIGVDLDGIGGADMSLNDLAAAIDAVDYISASVTADGRLAITADSPDFQFTFSEDSSGVLAAVGVNTFFTGTTGFDMGVNEKLNSNVQYLAAGNNHTPGSNENALNMVSLQDQTFNDLGGLSLRQTWQRHVEDLAVQTAKAQNEVQSRDVITESLSAQREAVSGVNVDEESINLLQYQRAYQGSARFITVIDEMMTTILGLIR